MDFVSSDKTLKLVGQICYKSELKSRARLAWELLFHVASVKFSNGKQFQPFIQVL